MKVTFRYLHPAKEGDTIHHHEYGLLKVVRVDGEWVTARDIRWQDFATPTMKWVLGGMLLFLAVLLAYLAAQLLSS